MLHEERLHDPNDSEDTQFKRFKTHIVPYTEEQLSEQLSNYTGNGSDLTQNWHWKQAGWGRLAPMIMASRLVEAAELNEDLREYMEFPGEVHFCYSGQTQPKSKKWCAEFKFSVRKVSASTFTKSPPSCTTRAFALAHDSWKRR